MSRPGTALTLLFNTTQNNTDQAWLVLLYQAHGVVRGKQTKELPSLGALCSVGCLRAMLRREV
jgi:hypothetical protein